MRTSEKILEIMKSMDEFKSKFPEHDKFCDVIYCQLAMIHSDYRSAEKEAEFCNPDGGPWMEQYRGN